MDVSRETPDVTTKPKCYDLANVLVRRGRPLLMLNELRSGVIGGVCRGIHIYIYIYIDIYIYIYIYMFYLFI